MDFLCQRESKTLEVSEGGYEDILYEDRGDWSSFPKIWTVEGILESQGHVSLRELLSSF